MRNKELEARNRELKKELDREQHAKRLVEELSEALKLQIQSVTVQHFKDFAEYLDELIEYGIAVYVECMDDVIKLKTERGVKVAVSILAELRAPFGAPVSFA